MKISSSQKLIVALCIPLFGLLAWVGNLERSILDGKQLRIRVEGYDPRDLLAGHYVRFQLALGSVDLPSDLGYQKEVCLCLEERPGEVFVSPTKIELCHAEASCPLYLRGEYHSGSFHAGIERYSIAERHAPVLAIAPPESSILVSITEQGRAVVLQYFVGDETLEEYADRKLLESSHQ